MARPTKFEEKRKPHKHTHDTTEQQKKAKTKKQKQKTGGPLVLHSIQTLSFNGTATPVLIYTYVPVLIVTHTFLKPIGLVVVLCQWLPTRIDVTNVECQSQSQSQSQEECQLPIHCKCQIHFPRSLPRQNLCSCIQNHCFYAIYICLYLVIKINM